MNKTIVATLGVEELPVDAFNFSLDVPPTSASVNLGKSAKFKVTLSPLGGKTEIVALSAEGLPPQASASFSLLRVDFKGNPPYESELTIAASSLAPVGTFTVTVVGSTPKGVTNYATLTLDVKEPPPPPPPPPPPGGFESMILQVQQNPAALGALFTILAAPIGWLFRKRSRSSLSRRIAHIHSLYRHHSANTQECEAKLMEAKENILGELEHGKLNEEQFRVLDSTIASYLQILATRKSNPDPDSTKPS
jgi:hypothetical protein